VQRSFIADGLMVVPVGKDRAASIAKNVDAPCDLAEEHLHRFG